jgi:polysaccharide chain length determinant protein (PEP-CTERM system associated)
MKPNDQTFADFLHVLRRRARPSASAALAVLLGMIFLTFSLPAVYQSSATLLIEHPDIPTDVIGGSGLDGYVEQRLQRTRQRVLTAENIDALIKRHHLFQGDGESDLSHDELITVFNESVLVTPQVTGVIDPRSMRTANLTYGFDVAFLYSDPVIARDVADSLAELFISASEEQAQDVSETTIEFLRSEGDRLEADLREREGRLAEFRQAYSGGLPEGREENLRRATDLERDLARVDDDLRNARARKDLLETQLQSTPRDTAVLNESGQPMLRGADRLAVAQQELVAALAKYSEDHPDVRRLRREIATLSAESSTSPSAAPTNPLYQQIQSQVSTADMTIRELMGRRNELSGMLGRVRSAIFDSPRYEKQHTDLVRDYEVIKEQYDQIRARQTTAEIAQKASTAQAAETYVLINPAMVPTSPIEPDRVSLMFLAVVLAIAAGLGTASLLNATDSTIRGGADVAALGGVQLLGHVPPMRSPMERRRHRLGDVALAGGMLAAVALVVYAVN